MQQQTNRRQGCLGCLGTAFLALLILIALGKGLGENKTNPPTDDSKVNVTTTSEQPTSEAFFEVYSVPVKVNANLRSGPGKDNKIHRTLPKGTKVELLSLEEIEGDRWFLVQSTGQLGWLHESVIQIEPNIVEVIARRAKSNKEQADKVEAWNKFSQLGYGYVQSTDYNGKPAVVGVSPSNTGIVMVVHDKGHVVSSIMSVFFNEDGQLHARGRKELSDFIAVIMPNWHDGEKWLKENIPTVMKTHQLARSNPDTDSVIKLEATDYTISLLYESPGE